MSRTRQLWLLAIVLSAALVSIYVSAEGKGMLWRTSSEAASLPIEGPMPSLDGATTWLNSQPLSGIDLRGKVVLVQFWTYTCINWIRTAPYVRAWAEKYKDHGLVVIGVHTPEFSVENDLGNVGRATKEQNVGYPVAVDNDYVIWRAFDNNYWPAFYLVDAQGRVRHHQFGEGEYDRLETIIQQLLADAGYTDFDRALVTAEGQGAERAADWTNLATPETYVGYGRGERFSSPGNPALGQPGLYAAPAELDGNAWALVGDWTIRKESSLLNAANGKMVFRFHARDLHLVMGSAKPGASLRYRVLIDGHPPGASHGVDVDAAGHGTIDQPRMYQLIRQPGAIEDRQFEIEFLDPGVEVFVFTFG